MIIAITIAAILYLLGATSFYFFIDAVNERNLYTTAFMAALLWPFAAMWIIYTEIRK